MAFFEIHKQIEQDLAFLSNWAMFPLRTDHQKTYRWGGGRSTKKIFAQAREN